LLAAWSILAPMWLGPWPAASWNGPWSIELKEHSATLFVSTNLRSQLNLNAPPHHLHSHLFLPLLSGLEQGLLNREVICKALYKTCLNVAPISHFSQLCPNLLSRVFQIGWWLWNPVGTTSGGLGLIRSSPIISKISSQKAMRTLLRMASRKGRFSLTNQWSFCRCTCRSWAVASSPVASCWVSHLGPRPKAERAQVYTLALPYGRWNEWPTTILFHPLNDMSAPMGEWHKKAYQAVHD
jgi:hypothetical protein